MAKNTITQEGALSSTVREQINNNFDEVYADKAFRRFIGISDVLGPTAGTWTATRGAQGNWYLRKTAAAETVIIGIDVTEALAATADKGFRLDSFDVTHQNATADLNAHTATLSRVLYTLGTNAPTIDNIAVSGSLSVAQLANARTTNITVDSPGYLNITRAKYVIEVTVDAAAGSVYDFHGIDLVFTRNDTF